jgi:hypothetical protein
VTNDLHIDAWRTTSYPLTAIHDAYSAISTRGLLLQGEPVSIRAIHMNNTTQELTSSLQELTARKTQHAHSEHEQTTPSSLAADDLTFSEEVQTFLEQSQSYAAATRAVNVGSY